MWVGERSSATSTEQAALRAELTCPEVADHVAMLAEADDADRLHARAWALLSRTSGPRHPLPRAPPTLACSLAMRPQTLAVAALAAGLLAPVFARTSTSSLPSYGRYAHPIGAATSPHELTPDGHRDGKPGGYVAHLPSRHFRGFVHRRKSPSRVIRELRCHWPDSLRDWSSSGALMHLTPCWIITTVEMRL